MKARKHFATVGLLVAMVLTANAQTSIEKAYSFHTDALDYTISTCETPDGGHLLGGNVGSEGNKDYRVVRVDKSGTKLWDHTYGGNKVDELTTLRATLDGGYVIGGRSNSTISGDKSEYNKGEYDFWIVKIDEDGNVEWDRTYGGAEKDNLVTIEEMNDGVLVLAGYSDSRSRAFQDREFDFLVIWIDGSGNILSEFRYGTKRKDILTSATILNDQGIILGGFSSSESPSGFDYNLLKIDRFGTTVWKQTLGNASDEFLAGVAVMDPADDGGFILYGEGIAYPWIMKFDLDGNRLWIDPSGTEIYAEVED